MLGLCTMLEGWSAAMNRASPQLEDGYTRIANELIEALMRTNLSAYQSRVLWAIWRKTYGFNKRKRIGFRTANWWR